MIHIIGAGESGKSTILKQFRVFNSLQYSQSELQDFRKVVNENLASNMVSIINGLKDNHINLTVDNFENCVHTVQEYFHNTKEEKLPEVVYTSLKTLLKDPAVVAALKASNKYQLSDSAD
jgi:guanine nucleotide-binding protein subunit alpha